MYFYALDISYDGTNFFGSAKQKNLRTVEEELLKALIKITKNELLSLTFAGRTDKTVHALHNVVSFDVEQKIKLPKNKLIFALNKLLPSDIKVNHIKLYQEFFNARFDAKQRVYDYFIQTKPFNLFARNHVLQYEKTLHVNKIKKALKIFVGEHDFLSFSTSEKQNTIRTIYKITFNKTKSNLYKLSVYGNGFLRSQIRMLVGSLLKYNEDKITLADLQYLLDHPKKGASLTKVSGCGLYLRKICY